MKKAWLILSALFLAPFLNGCWFGSWKWEFPFPELEKIFMPVYSRNPLHERQDLIKVPDLTGVWVDPEESGPKKRTTAYSRGDDGLYRIVISEDERTTAELSGALVKIHGRYFLDVFSISGEDTLYPPPGSHLIFHLTVKGEDRMELGFLVQIWMKGYLASENGAAVQHESVDIDPGVKAIVLTASTKSLKKLIDSIADKEGAFDQIVFGFKKVAAGE